MQDEGLIGAMAASTMSRTPGEAVRQLRESLANGEWETAASCFTRDACFVTPDHTAVHGREAVLQLLRQLSESALELRAESLGLLVTEHTALVRERWTIASSDGHGDRYVRSFRTSLVMCRIEGRWKVAVAAPWNWAEVP